MFALDDTTLVLSATDLTNHLACPHLTQQRLAIARGERGRPRPADDPHGDLIRERGQLHEDEQLRLLVDEAGGDHQPLSEGPPAYTREALDDATAETLAAMRAGRALISQAQLFDGRWQGRPDVLRRIATASALGDWSYEVLDMKLAREVKPHVVHQLSLYNRLLGELQGRMPDIASVILGDGTRAPVDLPAYDALHAHVARRLETVVNAPAAATYPEPVAHCAICFLAAECHARRRRDDHLSLVAGARRDQREKLVGAGLPTVATLGAAPADHELAGLAPERFELLRHQAALQVDSRITGQPRHRHLRPAAERGLARLPDPSPGDVFFDFEGDPYVGESGIEYLWGWWTDEHGYDCLWAHDKAEEKLALERFVTFLCERRDRYPGLHVFHYAPHETSKLASLAEEHDNCSREVDCLLRDGVFVDLYAVVRQGLQVGEESYSLKRLERHHAFRRLERSVREGGGSIIAYEAYRADESSAGALLEPIRAYNEDDCRSTASLRDWLHERMRPEAVAEFGPEAFVFEEDEPFPEPKWLPDALALVERLVGALPADDAADTPADAERRLLADLLLYHYRESKPQFREIIALRKLTPVELLDERAALSGLWPDPSRPPVPVKRSLDYAFAFPAQEFKLSLGDVEDPTTKTTYKLVAVADDHVRLRRGAGAEPPAPAALIPAGPPQVGVLRKALFTLAEDVLAGGGRFAAGRSVLRRDRPVLRSGVLGPSVDDLVSATLGLERSHLAVQGPPGTGKTYRGARMVGEALRAGRRVGITGPSHAAIQNLLRDIEAYAVEAGIAFRGVYKGDSYVSAHERVDVVSTNDIDQGEYDLVAGTAWLFARTEWQEKLSLLFIDEAGQFALASAIAVSTAAESLVMLGDPQQLPQVTQARHPGTSGCSVLDHLLDGEPIVARDRGVLLDESWRMHPDVCAFVSERSYRGELRSRAECGRRQVVSDGPLDGAGLRLVPVEHEGRSQASVEESIVIADLCADLLDGSGATVIGSDGHESTLHPRDIMVVAPYNLAVECIRERVPGGVRVGTVDRFQGQEAPVVFFAVTCSSGEDVPRGLDFLFSRNRLNVAISRAQCLAIVVASPRLLDADCRTLATMALVNDACRFAEMAGVVRPRGL